MRVETLPNKKAIAVLQELSDKVSNKLTFGEVQQLGLSIETITFTITDETGSNLSDYTKDFAEELANSLINCSYCHGCVGCVDCFFTTNFI